MRNLLSTLAALALAAAILFAQAPADKGKAGKGPKNLKVLQAKNLTGVMAVMQTFVPALGLEEKGGCNYCHVADDRSADDKPEKVMARMMMQMVREINAKFPDGGEHVTCWTCHRGATKPETTKG